MNPTITKPAADTHFGRRPLGRLADDKMRQGGQGPTLLGRVLRETGRKGVAVAAFGSSV